MEVTHKYPNGEVRIPFLEETVSKLLLQSLVVEIPDIDKKYDYLYSFEIHCWAFFHAISYISVLIGPRLTKIEEEEIKKTFKDFLNSINEAEILVPYSQKPYKGKKNKYYRDDRVWERNFKVNWLRLARPYEIKLRNLISKYNQRYVIPFNIFIEEHKLRKIYPRECGIHVLGVFRK